MARLPEAISTELSSVHRVLAYSNKDEFVPAYLDSLALKNSMYRLVKSIMERATGVATVKVQTDAITADLVRIAQQPATLLNQQIWCWGQDIEAAGGNLLVHYGFQRIEKPPESTGSSLYRMKLPLTSRVILRGFGVFIGDDRNGGVFLPRFEFTPKFSIESDFSDATWHAEDLSAFSKPSQDQVSSCQKLLLTLIEWIHRYEVWIANKAGYEYRNETLINWKKKHGSVIPAEEMAAAWRVLGSAVSEQPKRFIRCQES